MIEQPQETQKVTKNRAGSIEKGIASFLCLFVLFVAVVLRLRQATAPGSIRGFLTPEFKELI